MSYVKENFDIINQEINNLSSGNCQLLAVSKTFGAEAILELYNDGDVRDFAESKLQELELKYTQLPKDINWHFIGKIQSNKLKKIVRYCKVIHSVENVKTIEKMAKQCREENLKVSYYIEVNVSNELSKSGLKVDELDSILKVAKEYENDLTCLGFMTMAPLNASNEALKLYFSSLKTLLDDSRGKYELESMKNLSMGMSEDYAEAISCGSTCVRVGSAIFGKRDYGVKK